jgi:hypothetical protein
MCLNLQLPAQQKIKMTKLLRVFEINPIIIHKVVFVSWQYSLFNLQQLRPNKKSSSV